MTHEHIIFIPVIFFIGFILGKLSSTKNKHTSPSRKGLIISLITFVSLFVSTHIFPFFGGVKALSFVLYGMPIFDQRPSFSSFDVYQRLVDFGSEGREMYQRFTYSADLVFPISFLIFLIMLSKFINERYQPSKNWKKVFITLPILWFFSDVIENVIVFKLLSIFPLENIFLGNVLGEVTVAKFFLLLMSIFAPAIFVIFYHRSND
jgi:hypothetical protein